MHVIKICFDKNTSNQISVKTFPWFLDAAIQCARGIYTGLKLFQEYISRILYSVCDS